MTARVTVRLTPRASRDEIVGFDGETLRVRVTAPPVDGRANQALTRLLAKALGVGRGDVRIVSGQGARTKVVEVEGPDEAGIRRALL
jgi:uncharacterized protein (TIGR00251 family)